MTGKRATKRVLTYLKKKSPFEGISTQKELAEYLGVSHMTIWERMKNGGWTGASIQQALFEY